MGRLASSSKRKSSKRKSSKLSQEGRKRNKSMRNKLKKLNRRDDSDSSYADDDSLSSVSFSSTSSEEDHESRKVQSRSHSDAKSGRKKSRRRSSSKDPSRSKKRKRSKKDVDSKSRKKSRKTKRKREVSISSTSSDSSTKSSEESEPEGGRGRSREKKKNKRDPLKNKIRNSYSRSRSCSYSSRSSDHGRSVSPGGEEIVVQNKSGRLKSVISVVEHRHETDDNKSEKDPYKEEIFYDHDDYPYSRSNDSYDGVSRRESFSRVASEKRQKQYVTEEEVSLPSLRIKEPVEDDSSYRLKTTISEKENENTIPIKVAGSCSDDLELILRQQALENLRRFRGERKMKSKTTSGEENEKNTSNEQLCAATAEDVHEKSFKLDASNEHCPATYIEKSDNNHMLERDLTNQAEILMNNSGGGKSLNDPGVSKQNDIHQSLSEKSKKENISTAFVINEKSGSGLSSPRQGNSSTCSEVKQATTSRAPPDSNLLASTLSKTTSTISPGSDDNQARGVGVVNACSSTSKEAKDSCGESSSVEHSSKKLQDESKDGSQFENKTMSVMRGGEMVQVSYKVYIPKKVPALARRQLKR